MLQQIYRIGICRLLDQLLETICDNKITGFSSATVNQDKECITVATLNLLHLQVNYYCFWKICLQLIVFDSQLYSVISNNFNVKSVGLSPVSKLLNSIKSKIVHLASSPAIVPTIQQAAQAALQAGWSVLLPTASERAETLTSLLSNSEQGPTNCGHRFMTDLLVWSLMADGGLEMALYEALRVEIAELAEADETFEMPTCNTAIPLLHLIKQLLRNISFVTHAKLQELRNGGNKVSEQKVPSSPSSSLLQRFQRLLIMKIYSKDSNCALAAESLLKKYLYQLSSHVTHTLNVAYEIAAVNCGNVAQIMQILKDDITGLF